MTNSEIKQRILLLLGEKPMHTKDIVIAVQQVSNNNGFTIRNSIRELMDRGIIDLTLDMKLAKNK